MSVLKSLIPIALSLLITGPAFALSCMPYSARHAFQDASASPDIYLVVHGQLRFNPADLPVVDMSQQNMIAANNFFNASLTGNYLTASGFDAAFAQEIQVNAQCFGPWCGGVNTGSDYLMFLKQTDTGYLLEVNPCGGFAFQHPSLEILNDMNQCLLGGECEPLQY